MEDLNTISEKVKQILEDEPAARDSDNLLFWKIAHDTLEGQGLDIDTMSFTELFLSLNSYGIPKFETVGRIRRKIQSDFPELKGTGRITAARELKAESFRAYAHE